MYLRLTLLCVVALIAGLYLQLFGFGPPVRQSSESPAPEGVFWPQQKMLTDFQMVDQDGEVFNLEDFQGKWSLVFFGYTHCPDICPVTLNVMRESRDLLARSHAKILDNVNYQFVSVDGERDSPEHLNAYLKFFGEYFNGATGNKEQVDSLAEQLGVPYAVDEHEPGDTNYLVAHTGVVFLISPQGTLASIYQPPHSAEQLNKRLLETAEFMSNQS